MILKILKKKLQFHLIKYFQIKKIINQFLIIWLEVKLTTH